MKWNESQDELAKLYKDGKTTVYSFKSIYQVFHSVAQGKYYTRVIKSSNTPYTLRGRIQATSDRV